jgi:hypothetical protein
MKPWAALMMVVAIQSPTLSPRQLATLARPLQPAEINAVLGASREAIANKTFTLSYLGREDGLEILMRTDGWPRIVRGEGDLEGLEGGIVVAGAAAGAVTATRWRDHFVDIVEYTGAAARRCDGATVPGELVVTYEHQRSTNTWTAHAGTKGQRAGVPVFNPVFDVLTGRAPAVSEETTVTEGRTERGFTAPFSAPPSTYGLTDPTLRASQTLWIDVDSLLPVRWQVTAGGSVTDTRVLTYKPLGLRPPDGVEPPRCIP